MGKFVVIKQGNGFFRFNLKADNGQTILVSESYSTLAACENGIASVKKNATTDSRFLKLTALNGQYYFNLTAGNGQVIGTSEMYTTEASRDAGLEAVKQLAPPASVELQPS